MSSSALFFYHFRISSKSIGQNGSVWSFIFESQDPMIVLLFHGLFLLSTCLSVSILQGSHTSKSMRDLKIFYHAVLNLYNQSTLTCDSLSSLTCIRWLTTIAQLLVSNMCAIPPKLLVEKESNKEINKTSMRITQRPYMFPFKLRCVHKSHRSHYSQMQEEKSTEIRVTSLWQLALYL